MVHLYSVLMQAAARVVAKSGQAGFAEDQRYSWIRIDSTVGE
jgi:hypothetical protein